MSYTPYSTANAEFSNLAHLAAQRLIYPKMFNVPFEKLTFEDTTIKNGSGARARALDGEMGIDKIVKIEITNFKMPMLFTIQERFRKIKFTRYQDLTITEWNNSSNLPSELYKISANFFLYGYFDDTTGTFTDIIATVVPTMLIGLCNGNLSHTQGRNPRSNQSFISLKFSDLHRSGCVMYRFEK